MLRALTRAVSQNIGACELTFRRREAINYRLATRQHEEYCGLLRYHGVEVTKLEASDAWPDCCFVEDAAIVFDEVAVITSMGVVSRRGEAAAIERELSRFRAVTRIRLPAMIEGGDVVRLDKRIFVGLSTRTNAQGIEDLRAILQPFGYTVTPVEVRSSLHLSTACSALDAETTLINPRWIDADAFSGVEVLTVPEDEPWAANTLRLGQTICLEAEAPRTLEMVSRLNHNIEVLDISEFRKAEGSLSCLSIVFRDGHA
ncbi:MAG: dimethylargininase [Acidobacteria bacterium]|nr:dimethylargininase [Acidobacteriota bacterium]